MEHDYGHVVVGDALERSTSGIADGIVTNVRHSRALPVHGQSYFKSANDTRYVF